MTGSLQRQTTEKPYTPYRIMPHHYRLKRRGHQPKKSPRNDPCIHFSTLRWARAGRILPSVCPSRFPPQPGARLEPLVKHDQGLPVVDKHCHPRGLRKRRPYVPVMTDVATRAHAHQTSCTQVPNPSHRRLT
jgi:hypothetical protein